MRRGREGELLLNGAGSLGLSHFTNTAFLPSSSSSSFRVSESVRLAKLPHSNCLNNSERGRGFGVEGRADMDSAVQAANSQTRTSAAPQHCVNIWKHRVYNCDRIQTTIKQATCYIHLLPRNINYTLGLHFNWFIHKCNSRSV